jgi:uncharacterized protein (TIGR02646 family)
MRPLDRGPRPEDAKGPKTFAHYQDARRDLMDRLGQYCSYCERELTHSPHVEHVWPKSTHRHRALRWDNFLLACNNCNSHKNVSFSGALRDYYWPDRHNTALSLHYESSGLVQANPALTRARRRRAQRTIDLTELNCQPIDDTGARDVRLELRLAAWREAEEARRDLRQRDDPVVRKYVAKLARARGFWSVWMTVFRDDRDMLKRLIEAFPGTATCCFDDECRPVPRPGGAL